jgi:hypothetical protein
MVGQDSGILKGQGQWYIAMQRWIPRTAAYCNATTYIEESCIDTEIEKEFQTVTSSNSTESEFECRSGTPVGTQICDRTSR